MTILKKTHCTLCNILIFFLALENFKVTLHNVHDIIYTLIHTYFIHYTAPQPPYRLGYNRIVIYL